MIYIIVGNKYNIDYDKYGYDWQQGNSCSWCKKASPSSYKKMFRITIFMVWIYAMLTMTWQQYKISVGIKHCTQKTTMVQISRMWRYAVASHSTILYHVCFHYSQPIPSPGNDIIALYIPKTALMSPAGPLQNPCAQVYTLIPCTWQNATLRGAGLNPEMSNNQDLCR